MFALKLQAQRSRMYFATGILSEFRYNHEPSRKKNTHVIYRLGRSVLKDLFPNVPRPSSETSWKLFFRTGLAAGK